MIRFAVLLAAVLLVLPGRAASAAPEDGVKVYAAQKCALCHAIAGKGNAKGPLDDVGGRLSADEIRLWVTSPKEMSAKHNAERKPPMKSFATLPPKDVDALVEYLVTLKGAK